MYIYYMYIYIYIYIEREREILIVIAIKITMTGRKKVNREGGGEEKGRELKGDGNPTARRKARQRV